MRRSLLLLKRSLLLAVAGLCLLGTPHAAVVLGSVVFDAQTLDAAGAQVTPLDEDAEETPGLGDITGSPEAGPDPEDAGDRGGFAQLLLAVVIFGAIAFIVSRIALATRASGANAP